MTFDWWCFDWADFSVIPAGWFPLSSQRTGCLSVCLQAADTWGEEGEKKGKEKGDEDLTFCWTPNRTVGITIGGQCFLWGKLKCLNGVWAHKREIKETGKKVFLFFFIEVSSDRLTVIVLGRVGLLRKEKKGAREGKMLPGCTSQREVVFDHL